MQESKSQSRRNFLKHAAIASSFFILPRHVLGKGYIAPSDKVNLAFIGCGKQSGGLRNRFLDLPNTQLVAASDVYKTKLDTFINDAHAYYKTKRGDASYKGVQGYDDFREVLGRKDVDAVVIVTPDHWHAAMAVKAAEAGKDIYCEKPLSLTIKEGRAMVNATRKHNRVLQTGSMQRSAPEFTKAVQLVRTGAIGKVNKVIVSVGGPPVPWDLQPEATPADLNWDMWMGPNTIERPYSHRLAPPLSASFWPDWRKYDEFGGGMMTDWGAHMFDIAQWGLNKDDTGPTQIIYPISTGKEGSGLVYRYADGVEVHHIPSDKYYCHFIGSEGEVWVTRGELRTTPDTLRTKTFKASDSDVYVSTNHYKDFIDCIKSRQKPICDVEIGHRTASMCTIGNIAYKLQQTLEWDPKKEVFKNNKQANKLVGRPMKKEWAV